MKIFNYNTIYKNYKISLLNKLRAFGDDDDLSLWVPNEDITISILNLVDSMENSSVKIEFDKNSYNQIKKDFITKSLKAEGKINFSDTDYFIEFVRSSQTSKILVKKVKKIIQNKKSDVIEKKIEDEKLLNDEYFLNLKKVKINELSYKNEKISSSLVKSKYLDDNCLLEILINPNNHYIVDGTFVVKNNNDVISLFGKYFLNSIINLPINEAKDHLLIKIEYSLRPSKVTINKGIILKHKAGKIFTYFQKIIDNLYFDYVDKNKIKFGTNFYNYKIPEYWEKLTKDEKVEKINKNLNIFNLENSKDNPLKLVKIVSSNRLFFNMKNELLSNSDNRLFFKLENFLNHSLNMKIEVYYENRKDENALRSL